MQKRVQKISGNIFNKSIVSKDFADTADICKVHKFPVESLFSLC